ncbi:MAG TPA: hypothetical protein VGA56_12805 [Opitutaceae bacterium]
MAEYLAGKRLEHTHGLLSIRQLLSIEGEFRVTPNANDISMPRWNRPRNSPTRCSTPLHTTSRIAPPPSSGGGNPG